MFKGYIVPYPSVHWVKKESWSKQWNQPQLDLWNTGGTDQNNDPDLKPAWGEGQAPGQGVGLPGNDLPNHYTLFLNVMLMNYF